MTGAPYAEVTAWLHGDLDRKTGKRLGGWMREKTEYFESVHSEILKTNKEAIETIVASSLNLIAKQIQSLQVREEPLAPKDLKDLSTIATNVASIKDVAKDPLPKRYTPDQLRESLAKIQKADPFGAYSENEEEASKKLLSAMKPEDKDIV